MCLGFPLLVVDFFNEDKVMGTHIKSIPAIDTWRIQLQALLPDKPVLTSRPFFIPSSDTQSHVVLCVCMSHVVIFIKVAHSGSLFQPRPVELVSD